MIEEKFFTLLRLGMGMESDEDHSLCIAADEWPLLYKFAQEHTVIGIVLDGATKLNKDSYPPKHILLPWIGMVEQIKQRNVLMNVRCSELSSLLNEHGIDCCILKGQGVAQFYPKPTLRQCGDIDIWVKLQGGTLSNTNQQMREIKQRIAELEEGILGQTVYHHTEWQWRAVSVELHHRVLAFNNPYINRRFQCWCNKHWDECVGNSCMDNTYKVPTLEFNSVYLIIHLYHHLLFEGVGFRQLCDYAMLLQLAGFSKEKKHEITNTIESLGISRFAKGVMWLMSHILHVSEDKLLLKSNEEEGRFILKEVMRAGNFGHVTNNQTTSRESMFTRFVRRTRYRLKFFIRYPSEIIWDIPFRLYNYIWRVSYTAPREG